LKRKESRNKEGIPRERQIWISGPRGSTVWGSLEEAALYMTREAGVPVMAGQVLSALTLGIQICGMTFSHGKPGAGSGKRPTLLRRNFLEEGSRRVY
jgi:hypothetical protein